MTATVRETQDILHRWQARLDAQRGRRGNGPSRARLEAARKRLQDRMYPVYDRPVPYRTALLHRRALGLARMAHQYYDEHGRAGDIRTTRALDYVPPLEARQAPYLDSGHAGLGLVAVERQRYYSKTYMSSFGPGRPVTTVYLVGRNEAGTFFAHAVPKHISSVHGALAWMWSGHASDIILRQGDIAIIRGAGPRYPTLPTGHVITDVGITHATHPTIRLPGKGERVIVARRISQRVARDTRD